MTRFIDLFAGLGGFHVGLSAHGAKCVFASELNSELIELYEENYGIRPLGDIREVASDSIPPFELLCAGFPCQPFSKAGSQLGLRDDAKGTLFYEILKILNDHKPPMIILENVANIARHDGGRTLEVILRGLKRLGYKTSWKVLSPHQFGIPQMRRRFFLVAHSVSLEHFSWPEPKSLDLSIDQILDGESEGKKLDCRESDCLDIWQEFLDRIPKKAKLPSFPIWSTEWGADYPIEGLTPKFLEESRLSHFKGAFGVELRALSKDEQLKALPRYAVVNSRQYPKWKYDFIKKNRVFFQENRRRLAPVIHKIRMLPFSWQKFEWNCQNESRNIRELIVQFRASGIRVKRRDFSPALIASTSTQIPVLPWLNRYLSKDEAARLQSLDSIKLPDSNTSSFRALGNAVNAKVVELIAGSLLDNHRIVIGRRARVTI